MAQYLSLRAVRDENSGTLLRGCSKRFFYFLYAIASQTSVNARPAVGSDTSRFAEKPHLS
ncbi:MAG: hypothetical protein GDA37_12590, partial [Ekhidna sp.]|nr:hypothetical protein [Ekhidna sp.]